MHARRVNGEWFQAALKSLMDDVSFAKASAPRGVESPIAYCPQITPMNTEDACAVRSGGKSHRTKSGGAPEAKARDKPALAREASLSSSSSFSYSFSEEGSVEDEERGRARGGRARSLMVHRLHRLTPSRLWR